MNRFPGDGEKSPSVICPAVMGMTAMVIEMRAKETGVEPTWRLSEPDGCKVGSRMNRRRRKKGGQQSGV
jgi:hypothetical protein